MVITFFGDSITYGEWDPEGGWVQRLRAQADVWNHMPDPEPYVRIFNLGVPGNTTDDVLYRFEAELHPRMRPGEETVCVFAVGINDASLTLPEEKHRIDPETFQMHVRKMIEHARIYTSHVLCLGLTPVDERVTNPLISNQERAYRMVDITLYNTLLREVVRAQDCVFVDFLEAWAAEVGEAGWSEDGLHPGAQGHAWMAERVHQALKTMVPLPF